MDIMKKDDMLIDDIGRLIYPLLIVVCSMLTMEIMRFLFQ